MLNIDDRLIKEVLPKIKPNAFSVLLAIAIHLNKQSGRCFPSNDRLCKLTGLGRDSVYAALKTLKENGLLESHQTIDSKSKTFGQRTFSVTTRFISIFVTAQDAEPLPEIPYTANPYTADPDTANPYTANQETQQLNELERLNNLEQLNKFEQEVEEETREWSFSQFGEKPLLAKDSGPAAAPQNSAYSTTFDIDRAAESLTADPLCVDRFGRTLACSPETAAAKHPAAVTEFVADQKAVGYTYNNDRDFRSHYFNWLPLRVAKKRADKQKKTASNETFIPKNIPVFR